MDWFGWVKLVFFFLRKKIAGNYVNNFNSQENRNIKMITNKII